MALIRDEKIRLLGSVIEKDWTKFSHLISDSPNLTKDDKVSFLAEVMLLIHGDDLEAASRLRKMLVADDGE